MWQIILAPLFVAASSVGFALAQPPKPTVGLDAPQWRVFSDESGTRVDYPAGIFSVDAGPSPRGKGRELRSADERARLMVYVEDNEEGYTPASFIRTQLNAPRS
jgi:hypothetical protein